MTTLSLSLPKLSLGVVGRFFTTLFEGIRDGRRMSEEYDMLSRLSDSELASRGLDRSTLPQVVARSL